MSDSERKQQILASAGDLPPEQRSAYLDKACGGDQALRAEMESLLRSLNDAGRFLSSPTAEGPTFAGMVTDAAPARELPGTHIGPYKLLQQIGEGGFGSVFMAQQEYPVQRKVALKIIKLGMDTRQVVARFEQERQALAMMDHSNIAKVLDAGATETGRPYFVMELVKGDPIVEYCDKHNLNIRDRLALFSQVCTAVQHAHTKGIIHRDIKPSNVLVSLQDGRPHAKVIDFGIAKATSAQLTEKTLFTEHRQLIGTPEYMSPEQAEGSLDIDTRTDVYSLGVLLYELLTGSTPFSGKELRSAAYAEIQRIIREVDPPRPSTRLSEASDTIAGIAARRHTEPRKLGSLVRGELDWIVMKAMEKDRQRRYETANGLAMDINRYLAGEAVVAAPPGAGYRVRKFMKRHRTMVAAGSAVAAALLLGVVGFAWQASLARKERDQAVEARLREAEQRAAADAARDRAVAAETLATQKAKELKNVSDFQAKMLSGIDTTEAGRKLMADMKTRFENALTKEGVAESDRAARIAALSRELEQVNATDAAVQMIDETILKPALAAIDAGFKDQPTVDATLRHAMAEVYSVLGRLDEAVILQEAALATRRRVLGNDHVDTLTSVNNLGSILEAKGDAARAEKYYREALEGDRKVLGPEDPETLRVINNLGNLMRSQDKLADAEVLLKEALEVSRRVLGPEHRDTLVRMNTYGYVLIMQGRTAEAEPIWREMYETGKRVLGPEDRDVLIWGHNVGGLLGQMGRDRDAEPIFREALEASRRVLGEEHPGTMNCLGSLANSLEKQGRSAEAEGLLRRYLAVNVKTLGPEHPDTLLAMKRLGSSLRSQGKLEEAESVMRESLAGYRKVLGSQHPMTLFAMTAMASTLVDRLKWEEAKALFSEALDVLRKTKGDSHPDTLVTLNNLGNALYQEGRSEEAEPYFQQAVDGRRRLPGPPTSELAIALTNLAFVREEQNKLEESESLRREALQIFKKTLGDVHPSTLNALSNLAHSLRTLGKAAEAEPLARESVTGMENAVGHNSWRTAYSRVTLGRVLTNLGRFQEAETELVEAERVIATSPSITPIKRLTLARGYVELYTAWEKAEPGKGYGEKAEPWRAKLTK